MATVSPSTNIARVVSIKGAPRMTPSPISFPDPWPIRIATSGRIVSGNAVPMAARTLPTTPSESPNDSPTHSTPFVNSSAPPRITGRATMMAAISTRPSVSNIDAVDPGAFLERLEARSPNPQPAPELPEVLRRRLGLLGIEGLHPHQRQALDVLESGGNVIVATGTASGKTLVYNLASAADVLADPKRTALY